MTDAKPVTMVALHARIALGESKRLEAIRARFQVSMATVARRALQIGLAVLEEDPASFARAQSEEAEEAPP